jgi:hypothetical protein
VRFNPWWILPHQYDIHDLGEAFVALNVCRNALEYHRRHIEVVDRYLLARNKRCDNDILDLPGTSLMLNVTAGGPLRSPARDPGSWAGLGYESCY